MDRHGARALHDRRQRRRRSPTSCEEWFENEAADGFNILPPWLPGALDDFVDLVIPELQRRGLFRTAYEGSTLRENLGLPRPGQPLDRRPRAGARPPSEPMTRRTRR